MNLKNQIADDIKNAVSPTDDSRDYSDIADTVIEKVLHELWSDNVVNAAAAGMVVFQNAFDNPNNEFEGNLEDWHRAEASQALAWAANEVRRSAHSE